MCVVGNRLSVSDNFYWSSLGFPSSCILLFMSVYEPPKVRGLFVALRRCCTVVDLEIRSHV